MPSGCSEVKTLGKTVTGKESWTFKHFRRWRKEERLLPAQRSRRNGLCEQWGGDSKDSFAKSGDLIRTRLAWKGEAGWLCSNS